MTVGVSTSWTVILVPSNHRSSQAVWAELSQTACESVSALKDAFVLFALEMHTNRTFSFLLSES